MKSTPEALLREFNRLEDRDKRRIQEMIGASGKKTSTTLNAWRLVYEGVDLASYPDDNIMVVAQQENTAWT